MAVWGQRLRYSISLPVTPQASREADLPASHPTSLDALFQPCASPTLLRHPITQSVQGGIGFSTDCPSPTPSGLGLGPGLPWVDEPSPGNLRLSAGRILTCLLAYSCRHSHFSPVHMSFRSCFCPMRTLPYQLRSGMWEVRGETFNPIFLSAYTVASPEYHTLLLSFPLLDSLSLCLALTRLSFHLRTQEHFLRSA